MIALRIMTDFFLASQVSFSLTSFFLASQVSSDRESCSQLENFQSDVALVQALEAVFPSFLNL